MAESSGGATGTHIYEDYTKQKTCWNQVFTDENEIKTFITAKKQEKLFAKQNNGLSVKTASFSQRLIGTEVYKIVLDCDDDAPDLQSMEEQTAAIIDWAKTELAELLEVKAEDLAIHVSSREVGGVCKVSVGIVVTTLKCVLNDQWKYLTQRDVDKSAPVPLGSKACIIDKKIYRTGQLRMPNCHKPGEDPAGIKKPVTFTRNPIAHMPSCQMINSGVGQRVKVKLVAPDESEEEQEDEEESDESLDEDDFFEDCLGGMRSSLDFTAEDVKTMLNLIDPDVSYDGYFAVACFLRNYCHSGKKLFMDWMKNLKDPTHQHRIAKASAFFDGCAGYTGYTFRSLVYYAEKFHPAEVSEWRCQSLLYMDPYYISAHDYAQLMVTKMPALKFCQKDWFIYDPKTGTWKEIQVSLLKHKAKVLLMPEIDAVLLKLKEQLETAVKGKEFLKKKIKAWKKQKQQLGMTLNGTVVDHLKMPGIVENEIRWNDNDDGQMIWSVPFENGCIDMRESYPMELRPAPENLMIRFTTGNDFQDDWPRKEESIAEVKKFLASTVADTEGEDGEYDYIWMKKSAQLLGWNVWEEMNMGQGGGANGKTKSYELDKQAFGKLCGTLEPIYYQKARSDPN